MDNHESAFAFLDVFTESSSLLSIAFRINSEDIIHDLERGTHHVDEAAKGGLRLCALPSHLTNHSQRHAGQARRLVLDHLVVLGWRGQSILLVVPVDVPALAKVNRGHLFAKYSVHCQCLYWILNIVV